MSIMEKYMPINIKLTTAKRFADMGKILSQIANTSKSQTASDNFLYLQYSVLSSVYSQPMLAGGEDIAPLAPSPTIICHTWKGFST